MVTRTKRGSYEYYALYYEAPNPDDSYEMRLISSYPCEGPCVRHFRGIRLRHPLDLDGLTCCKDAKIERLVDITLHREDLHVYEDYD